MKIQPDPPDWQYDESKGLIVNFHDPEQVEVYGELQNTDVREEAGTTKSGVRSSPAAPLGAAG